jgi:hypothetical protein
MKMKKATLCLVAAALWVGCGGSSSPVGHLSVTPKSVELGHPGFVELTFAFQFDQPLEGSSGRQRVFVHLLDESGGIARTFDHDLPVPWRPGSSHEYGVLLYQSALAPPLAPGEYTLTVGLHDGSGRRWGLATGGERAGKDEYVVAKVRAADSVAATPMFLFPEVWRAAEGGTDRQVLARRWLGGTGSLRLASIRGAGHVWMSVGIPVADERTEELILDEGETTPAVDVATTCSDFTVRLEGQGSHSISVPVGGEGELPAECEVSFDSNFYLIELDTLGRRTVALENISWAPDGD